MASQIDSTKPASGTARLADLADNMTRARDEITALQASVASPGPLGATGPTGVVGATGVSGVQGATGVTGASGVSGVGGGGGPPVIMQGTMPTGAEAVTGALWYNTNNGTLWLHHPAAGGWDNII